VVIMDNVFKAIITAGVTNLVTNNLILAICLGWAVYLYESKKDDQRI
jgi:Na+/H+-dicarboxylate symporter